MGNSVPPPKPTLSSGVAAAAAVATAASSPPSSSTVRGSARQTIGVPVRSQPSTSPPPAPSSGPVVCQPQRLTSAPVPLNAGAQTTKAPTAVVASTSQPLQQQSAQTAQQQASQQPQQQQVGIVTVNGVAGLQAADFPRALSVPAMHRRLDTAGAAPVAAGLGQPPGHR